MQLCFGELKLFLADAYVVVQCNCKVKWYFGKFASKYAKVELLCIFG